jgi:hypothetical protein
MNRDAETQDPDRAAHAELAAIEDDWAPAILFSDAARIAGFMTEWLGDCLRCRGYIRRSLPVRHPVWRAHALGPWSLPSEPDPGLRRHCGGHGAGDQHRTLRGARLDADEWTTDVVRAAGWPLAMRADPHRRSNPRLTAAAEQPAFLAGLGR